MKQLIIRRISKVKEILHQKNVIITRRKTIIILMVISREKSMSKLCKLPAKECEINNNKKH